MFEQLIDADQKKQARKTWITFPLSVLLHLIIGVIVIIVPLLEAESDLPPVKVINVFMAAPPPPSTPPPPPGKRKSTRKSKKEKKAEEVKQEQPISTGRLVAPIEIPEEIEEEDIGDFGLDDDFGVEGGVEGGVIGGVVGGVLGSDSPAETQALRIAQIQQPKLIKNPKPEYPQVALRAKIQGNVIINATTDIYGRVIRAQVINGHPLLRESARKAIMKWVYEPYILNGVPRPVQFSVVVKFNFNNR